jgi:hypothetical protein
MRFDFTIDLLFGLSSWSLLQQCVDIVIAYVRQVYFQVLVQTCIFYLCMNINKREKQVLVPYVRARNKDLTVMRM